MVKNYITTTLRYLFKNKIFSIINISGLAIGMACCILILLFVQYELSYDKFHKNGDNIYRVTREWFNSENISATLDFLKEKWGQYRPDYPYTYYFIDENFNRLYRSEEKLGQIFKYFSLLAIFIACLGLFGLASFTAEQRTKEIGIRKIVGASATSIVMMLSREFTKFVLISNLIAWPISYYVMNKWLQNFAFRTDFDIRIFMISSLISFCIALLTVSYQAIKAAVANPVAALQYE